MTSATTNFRAWVATFFCNLCNCLQPLVNLSQGLEDTQRKTLYHPRYGLSSITDYIDLVIDLKGTLYQFNGIMITL